MVTTILIILGILFILGLGFLISWNLKKDVIKKEDQPKNPDTECCGAHEVCDFDAVKADPKIIEYFDDEELDSYKNIQASNYSDEQIDEFREVLYTLKTDEVKHWLLSLSRRNIHLPKILSDEARSILIEEQTNH